MQIRFDDKTVAVSGAGHGFGRCVAETFTQLGACVFGCDLSAAELAETAKAGVKTQVLDLTDRGAAAAWIAQIEQTTGGAVDVLVNNAGGVAEQEMQPIEEVSDANWDRIFAVNIGAAFALSRAVAAGMKRAGSGRIVNLSSVIGQTGNIGQANYAASKAALFGLTQSLALETARKGITVNCVAPGFIATEMVTKIPQPILDGIIEKVPLRRLGRPEEVARVVRFLLEEESSYITGAMYAVNGGLFM